MGVSKDHGTPKSSIFIGFSLIFTIHFGFFFPLFLETSLLQDLNTLTFKKLILPSHGGIKRRKPPPVDPQLADLLDLLPV